MPMFEFKPLQHLILIALTKHVSEKNKIKQKTPDWTSFVQVPAPLNLPDTIFFAENFNSHFSL